MCVWFYAQALLNIKTHNIWNYNIKEALGPVRFCAYTSQLTNIFQFVLIIEPKESVFFITQ